MKENYQRNAPLLNTVFIFPISTDMTGYLIYSTDRYGTQVKKKKKNNGNLISAGFHFKGYTITYSKVH